MCGERPGNQDYDRAVRLPELVRGMVGPRGPGGRWAGRGVRKARPRLSRSQLQPVDAKASAG